MQFVGQDSVQINTADLMNNGKSVLVVTFNITLWHYLRDLMVRGIDRPDCMSMVRLMHFHQWCKHVCFEAGWDKRYEALVKQANAFGDVRALLETHMPVLAEEATAQPGVNQYDAILVDEGQDFRPNWWRSLRKVLKPDGEMLLVADATQDVYGTATAWTDEVMEGAGFRGDWAKLSVSYRLPPLTLQMAREFAQRFLPDETLDLPQPDQGSLDLYPCTLRWVQCSPTSASEVCADEIVAMLKLTGKNGLANADVTFLADKTRFGASVIKCLDALNLKSVNTYAQTEEERRRQKMAFYMGDARIKATTLHSFKGWEGRLLVVYIGSVTDTQNLALIYAGLTRLKRSTSGSWLTVVCTAPEIKEFGESWPSFSDCTERYGNAPASEFIPVLAR